MEGLKYLYLHLSLILKMNKIVSITKWGSVNDGRTVILGELSLLILQ